MNKFTLKDAPSQKGKIAIVTGANEGIGYYTTLGLLHKGAKVVMASRNPTKVDKAIGSIKNEIPKADVSFIPLDLNSLESVREFVNEFQQQHNALDILVNNAGIMIPPFAKTEEGFESQMGVNYFGHFLLTGLLKDALNSADSARVVSLSSIAHKSAKIDFENLNAEKKYSKMGAYAQSKLACLMFAYELDRRLKKSKSKVLSLAAHPGASATNLFNNIPVLPTSLIARIMSPVFNSPKEAALPSLMAALDPLSNGGDYYGPLGFMEMSGSPAKVKSKPQSHDKAVARKLWKVSEELVGFEFKF